MHYINLNDSVRYFLTKKLNELCQNFDSAQALIEYMDFFNELKKFPNLYQLVIGLCFADSYRILLYRNEFHKLKEEEKERLELFSNIKDFADLEMNIMIDEEFLYYISKMPIFLYSLPMNTKANIILRLEDKLQPFDMFHELEKQSLFNDITSEQLIKLYKKSFKFYLNQGNNKVNSEALALDDIIKKLYTLSIGNKSCFKKIMMEILIEYYKCKKTIQVINKDYLNQNEEIFIRAIEEDNLNLILKALLYKENKELLTDIVIEYIFYNLENRTCSKNIVDDIYLEIVPEKVKRKIKGSLL